MRRKLAFAALLLTSLAGAPAAHADANYYLVVKRSFSTYAVGQQITDPSIVKLIMTSDLRQYVDQLYVRPAGTINPDGTTSDGTMPSGN